MARQLFKSLLNTPLGSIVSLSDGQKLYLLEFSDSNKLEGKLHKITHTMQAALISEHKYTPLLGLLQQELDLYFAHKLQEFTVPIYLTGTVFQQRVWRELQVVSYGHTQSYVSLAEKIDYPSACRAVAQANSANCFMIIIPCHRIINKNGTLGGYSAGIARKQWLLNHENTTRV